MLGSGVVSSYKPSFPWHWAKPLVFQNWPMTPASRLICLAALWSRQDAGDRPHFTAGETEVLET